MRRTWLRIPATPRSLLVTIPGPGHQARHPYAHGHALGQLHLAVVVIVAVLRLVIVVDDVLQQTVIVRRVIMEFLEGMFLYILII